MASPPVRIGIIGCGGIAAFAHIPALLADRKSAKLVALADAKKSRAGRIRTRFQLADAEVYTNYQEILRDSSIDAVIIAAWPAVNIQIAIDAIRAGKHVLVQKPLLADAETTRSFAHIANDCKTQILALPHIESAGQFQHLKSRIFGGDLGVIRSIHIRTVIPGPEDYYHDVRQFFGETEGELPFLEPEYAKSRGCLSDMGVYALAAFHYLIGSGSVRCCVRSSAAFERCATVVLMAEVPELSDEPILGCLEAGWAQMSADPIVSVLGSRGAVTVACNGEIVNHGSRPLRPYQAPAIRSLLPMSPANGQREWIAAVYTKQSMLFSESVARATWITDTLNQAYGNAL